MQQTVKTKSQLFESLNCFRLANKSTILKFLCLILAKNDFEVVMDVIFCT